MRRRAAGSGTPATNAAVSGARSAAVRNTPPQVVSSTGSVGSAGQYDPVSRRSSTASSLLARPTPATSRVGPAAVGAELVGLFRAPGARFVLVQRGGVTQDRFHHLPLGLHGVLAGEQLAVALQGVTEQPLVGWPVLPLPVGGGQRQALAGADVERHPRPTPAVDLELDRDVGFYIRVRRDTVLVPVAAELAADHAGRVQRPDGPQ